MDTVLDDLYTFLNANTSGLFISNGRLIDTPSTCIALIEILGFEPPAETFGSRVNIERPQIQIVSRAGKHDYKTARDNAETVYAAIRQASTTISGTKYFNLAIRSSPHFQGEDDNSRYVITFTVDAWKEPNA